ncbi:Peptidoglycan glycosyltransferase [Nitrospina gracilis 3/211]|uniref:Peptidoglycan glycosyltransferase n=1 Tax=Nitrospina gracilis (strain 3/211) TaxID=1266370 RepID=M1YV50_NITG3|nr:MULTISPECIES: penicillin-binding protein 2 [Nitrospina]MCF8722179.1 cell division protein FtsI (penicillin-binding protein 3) [Nitrospina sp. Nb-3]CCQ89372.1 Peptidoglycan glycosyltransferase [Nitrospina gracilis 3/211]
MRRIKKNSPQTLYSALKGRMAVVSVLFVVCGLALAGRLAHLQIFQHDELLSQAQKQYLRTVEVVTGRGHIFDRNRNLLATNLDVESVYIDPREIFNSKETARALAGTLNLNPETVLEKVNSKKHFVWIKRKARLDEISQLRQLDLPGVGFIKESKRFYPRRQLAASTLGFVGLDNQGLAGIEHERQSLLKGKLKRKVVEKDARGRYLQTGPDDASHRNRDLVLTLDEVIQFYAEQELEKQVREFQAKSGLVIVMDPNDGSIYALASYPGFNPNNFAAFPRKRWGNPAVTHAYEPGSIFKPIVVAAALEEGVARPNDIFFCENGNYEIGGIHIGEAANHRFGWLTLQNIISKSSNIGAIKVAQKLGEERFHEYIRNFGFGSRLGVDLPGETPGMVRDLSDWSGLSLASISFGHEISVSPLQMTAAIAAIANGGLLVKPHVTHEVLKNGEVVKQPEEQIIRRVLTRHTSRQMIDMLKQAVKHGTGKQAAIPGFEVAGKTGTAQKIDPETHTYSTSAYLASFIGFVPADAPRLVILVMIDEPQKSYWGGEVAAPVFQRLAEKTLRYLHIPSSRERVFVLDRT